MIYGVKVLARWLIAGRASPWGGLQKCFSIRVSWSLDSPKLHPHNELNLNVHSMVVYWLCFAHLIICTTKYFQETQTDLRWASCAPGIFSYNTGYIRITLFPPPTHTGAPYAPSKPVVHTLTSTSVSLTWNPPTFTGHSPITIYIIECKDTISNRSMNYSCYLPHCLTISFQSTSMFR